MTYTTRTIEQQQRADHDFAAKDSKGRSVGAMVITGMLIYTDRTDGYQGGYTVPAGTYFGLYTKSTRNGQSYGPLQHWQRFDTAAQRDAALQRYLVQARKKAQAKAA